RQVLSVQSATVVRFSAFAVGSLLVSHRAHFRHGVLPGVQKYVQEQGVVLRVLEVPVVDADFHGCFGLIVSVEALGPLLVLISGCLSVLGLLDIHSRFVSFSGNGTAPFTTWNCVGNAIAKVSDKWRFFNSEF